MTYEEIKDAARQVEQREDPSMSDDLFVRENTTSTPQDDGQWDWGGQPCHNQGSATVQGSDKALQSQLASCESSQHGRP